MTIKFRWLCLLLCLSLLCGCAAPNTAFTQPTDSTQPELTLPGGESSRLDSFGLCYQSDGGLNPYTTTRLVNRPILSLLYQGLFTVTSEYRAEPQLCKTFYHSDDLRTYVFQLVDATFSDGSVLTAEDVLASIQAARGSKVYGNRLRNVSSIEVTGEKELTIRLKIAYENLPVLLDIPIVRAEDVDAEHPLGTGAYTLSVGNELSLTRRADWWSEYPPAIDASVIALTDTAVPADIRDEFEFGRADLVCADPGSASYVEYRCDYELWDCATGILLYLGCNTTGRSVFSSSVLRSALTHGVDRSALAAVYRGFAQETYLPAAPTADCYDSLLASRYGYDPDRFREAASQSSGKTVRLLVNGDNAARTEAAELIALQLQALGLEVTVNAQDEAAYLKALRAGNYDLYLGEVRLSPNFDLSPFFSADGALNYGGMASDSISLLNTMALENSGNYYDLFEAVMDDGQLCPLLMRTYAVYATRGIVTDLMPGLDNVFHNANSRQLTDALTTWPQQGSTEPTVGTNPTEETTEP